MCNTQRKLVINITHKAVGPRHDPYDHETLTITRGLDVAVRESNGLGHESVKLFHNNELVKSITWNFFDKNKHKYNTLFASLLIKRHVGIKPEDAEQQYNETYVEDPMHSLAYYE